MKHENVGRKKQEGFLKTWPSRKRPFQNPTSLHDKTPERLGIEET